MTSGPGVEERGRALADAYLHNPDNRGAADRCAVFGMNAAEISNDLSAADFVAGGEYERYAERELDELAGYWEPHLDTPVRRALDAGCGAGVTTLALARRYRDAHVVGLDVESPGIELAKHLARDEPRCELRLQPLEALDDEPFDLIQCRCVLEHVYEPEHVLRTLIAHLNPGGALYLETPNYLFPWEPHIEVPMLPKSPKRLLIAQCRLMRRDPWFVPHLHFACDPITLRRWARRSGNVEIIDLMAQKAAAIFDSGNVQPRVPSRARAVRALKRFRPAAQAAKWAFTHLPVTPNVMFLIVKRGG